MTDHVVTSAPTGPDFDQAARFLTRLDETAERWTFQTFDDNKARKDSTLARILHGTLTEHWQELCELSSRGAGVFITVNETNGKGRKVADIIRVRAVFQECDRPGTPEPPLQPHIVVESSPGKYHRYLLVDGGNRFDLFEQVMARLVADFGSDPNAKDRARVLRLPGFPHQKDPAKPWMVRIIHESGELHYSMDAITAAIPPLLLEKTAAAVPPGKGIDNPVKVRSTLAALNPDMDYHSWLQVGMALHHATSGGIEGLTLWDEWSARGTSYHAGETAQKWRSFGSYNGTPVTLASVFKLATAEGWRWKDPPAESLKIVTPPPADEPPEWELPPIDAYCADPTPGHAPPPGKKAPADDDNKLLADYVTAESLDGKPFTRTWLVENLIEQGRVYEFFGKRKEGKTLAVIDLAAHLSLSRTWAERRTVHAMVVWVAGEAVDDVKMRIAAWRLRYGITASMPFYIRTKPVYMTNMAYADRLALEIEALKRKHPGLPALLVIDTVARCLAPGDAENSIEGLGTFANNVIDHVARPTQAAAICVHHSGHGDNDRGRGHSSFEAAIDGVVKVTMDKSNGPPIVTVSPGPMRSSAGDDAISFRVEIQVLPGQDNFGNKIEAPVLRHLPDHRTTQQPSGKHEKSAYAILQRLALAEALQASDVTVQSNDVPVWQPVPVTEWRAAFYEDLRKDAPEIETATVRVAWHRTRENLITKGLVTIVGKSAVLTQSVTSLQKRYIVTCNGGQKSVTSLHTPIGCVTCNACPCICDNHNVSEPSPPEPEDRAVGGGNATPPPKHSTPYRPSEPTEPADPGDVRRANPEQRTTGIAWANHTWNPWIGCIKVSPGCKHCYMYRDRMERFNHDLEAITTIKRTGDETFKKPLKLSAPSRVFTCSWSDFFIEQADAWRPEAWKIIRQTPGLTYLILTKRPENILARLPADWGSGYPNVWLGVSVESQSYLWRVEQLCQYPAVVRFISYEPALEPVDFRKHLEGIRWLISGGESGPSARPAELDWFRSVRDQCQQAGIAYFHKQHGGTHRVDGEWGGRVLDGQIWAEYPGTRAATPPPLSIDANALQGLLAAYRGYEQAERLAIRLRWQEPDGTRRVLAAAAELAVAGLAEVRNGAVQPILIAAQPAAIAACDLVDFDEALGVQP